MNPEPPPTGGWLAITLASVVVADLAAQKITPEVAGPLLSSLMDYADRIDPEPVSIRPPAR